MHSVPLRAFGGLLGLMVGVAFGSAGCKVEKWTRSGEFSCVADEQCAAGYRCKSGACWRADEAVCGDGVVEGNEACDDGGLEGSDGCSNACQIEQGWVCEGDGVNRCSPVGCDTAPTIENAAPPLVEGGVVGNSSPTFGTVAKYVCNSGFIKLGADLTCQTSGKWTPAPTCTAVDCGVPVKVDDASQTVVSGGASGGSTTTYGATASYSCRDGFQRDGNNSTCQADGKWSPAPTCDAVCGDGKVVGKESCDNGPSNGSYGYCNTTCVGPGPYCGDEVIQADFGEACDMGDALVSPCTEDCRVLASLSVGTAHTCLLTSGGGVKCWGRNQEGQLGDGDGSGEHLSPVDVSGLSSGVVAIAAGGGHTCALTNAGGVKCWGKDAFGQLGDGGASTNQSVPVGVSGLSSGVVAIAASQNSSCALTRTGGVKCWGWGRFGQLGDGGDNANQSAPVDVSGLSDGVVAIAMGLSHTCALTSAGGLKCWGNSRSGQLGNGDDSKYGSTPVDVLGLSGGIVGVAAGAGHTCALTASGGVKCWGRDNAGQLGDGGDNTDQLLPVDVSGLSSGVIAIAAGDYHTCALTSSGGVKCWGWDEYGQLGDGGNSDQPLPVDVSGLASGVVAIAAGPEHTCALTHVGGVECWGRNHAGQLGNGESGQNRSTPVDVRFPNGIEISKF